MDGGASNLKVRPSGGSKDVMAFFSHRGRIYLLQQGEGMDSMIALDGRGARFGRHLRHLECPMFKKRENKSDSDREGIHG